MNTPAMSSGSRSREANRVFTAAARFVGLVIVAAFAVFALGLWWVNGCRSGAGEPLAGCSAVQRNVLAIGAPLILLAGGIGAFVRTYQTWKARGRWWIWQGAGWFLLALMLVVLRMTTPAALL